MKARDYQLAAIEAMNVFLAEGEGHGLCVLATGAGKSVVLGLFTKGQIQTIGDLRIGIITHSRELVQQDYQALLRSWRGAPATIYCSGLGQHNPRGQIVVGSIQSLYDKAHLLGNLDLLLIDEAHRIPREAETQYGRLILDLQQKVPWLRVIGLTASPWRGNRLMTEIEGPKLFDTIFFEKPAPELIAEGWLCKPIVKSTKAQISVKGIKKSGEDYNRAQAEEAAEAVVSEACLELLQRTVDRKKVLVFAASIAHAYHIKDLLTDLGASSEVIHGEMLTTERDSILRRHRAGEFKYLINMGVLTTGYDDPGIDVVALMRITASLTLLHQIVGRGFRPMWPDNFDPNSATAEERIEAQANGPKPNFLFLDFSNHVERLGPIDDPKVKSPNKKAKADSAGGVGASKTCPTDGCETIVSVNTRCCPDCDYEWPFVAKPRHDATVAEQEIIRGTPAVPVSDTKWVAVEKILYELWRKPDKPETLRVSYSTDDMKSHSEWLSFEGDYGPSRATKDFFCEALPGTDIPATAREAMDLLPQMRPITRLAVRKPKGSRYSEIRVRQASTVPDMPSVSFLCTECANVLPVGDTCPCATGLKLPARKQHMPIEHDWDDDIPF